MNQGSQEAPGDQAGSDNGSYGSLNELYDHNENEASDNDISDVEHEEDSVPENENQEQIKIMDSDNKAVGKRPDLPQSQPQPNFMSHLFNLGGPKQMVEPERKISASQDNKSPAENNPFVNLFGWIAKDENAKKGETEISGKDDATNVGERKAEGVDDDMDATSPLSSSSRNNIEMELNYSPGGGLQVECDPEATDSAQHNNISATDKIIENGNDQSSSNDEIRGAKRNTETANSHDELINEEEDIDKDYVTVVNTEALKPTITPSAQVASSRHSKEGHFQEDAHSSMDKEDGPIQKRDLSTKNDTNIVLENEEENSDVKSSSALIVKAHTEVKNKNVVENSLVLAQDSKRLNQEGVRSQVLQMLKLHDPSKVKKIDKMMDRFKGREVELLGKMETRYLTQKEQDQQGLPCDEEGGNGKKPSPKPAQLIALRATEVVMIGKNEIINNDGEGDETLQVSFFI